MTEDTATNDDVYHENESTQPSNAWHKCRRYMAEEIDQSWTDVILIFSCFLTGLVDSSIYNVYTCFVSMQTGNAIYAGLGATGQPFTSPYRGAKALCSILSFCIGALTFSRVAKWMTPLQRSSMVFSWLAQAAFIFVSAGILMSGLIPPGAADDKDLNPIILLPIGLLSFQAAGQIVQSRVLEFNEVPTVVVTVTLCDLMLDSHLFSLGLRGTSKRNRRAASVAALVTGAIVGGLLTKDHDAARVLWLAGGLKTACAGIWLFWKQKGGIRLD